MTPQSRAEAPFDAAPRCRLPREPACTVEAERFVEPSLGGRPVRSKDAVAGHDGLRAQSREVLAYLVETMGAAVNGRAPPSLLPPDAG